MSVTTRSRLLLPVLVYCGLCTSIISSLGVLLIPTIADAQDVSLAAGQWILTVNLLVGSVATPVLGRLADRGHPARVLYGTLATVALGSAFAATAGTFGQLLVGRALQGVTYAIIPVAIALIRTHLPPDQVRAGVGVLSVTAATGIGLGYPLTGAVAEYLDYRVAFWAAVVFAGSALLMAPFVLPNAAEENVREPSSPRRFDLPGTVLFGSGLAAGLLGLAESERWGWGSPAVVGLLTASAGLLATWVWWELRVPAPLIRLDLLRHGDVRLAQLASLGFGMSMYAAFATSSQLAQTPSSTGYGLGLSAFAAGLVILPLALASQFAGRIAVPLSQRVGQHAMLPIAAVAVTAANLGLIFRHSRTWELLVAMALLGLGLGTAWGALPNLLLGAVPAGELGSATGVSQVLRNVGGAFSSAAIGAVLAAYTVAGAPTDEGYRAIFTLSCATSVLLLVWLVLRAVRARPERSAEPGYAL